MCMSHLMLSECRVISNTCSIREKTFQNSIVRLSKKTRDSKKMSFDNSIQFNSIQFNSSELENVFSTQQDYGVNISIETFQRYKK
jgi:hypothetical protein